MKPFEYIMWGAVMVLITIALNGCSFQSPVLDSENERAGFVITAPPMQISYRGDMTPEAHAFTLHALAIMKDVEFKDYKFNTDHNIRLNSIDAKADNVSINLHEYSDNNNTK